MFIAILIAAVVLALLGCITLPEKPIERITTLKIGYQPSTHHIAEMVAAERGMWQSDLSPFGIAEIKEYVFQSGPPEMQAMLAGDLDVAYVGVAPPISAIAQGLDAKIVAGVSINGSNLVFRTGLAYHGPGSLEGLSVGTFPPGSIQDIILKKWLKENGVDISKVKIIPMGPGDAITAILAGKVDAVFLPQPSPAIIELSGKGRSVLTAGEMWPNHAANCLLVSGKMIREHPDLVAQIIRTHINATNYANAHPLEAAEIYANRTQQDLKAILYSLQTWDGRLISDPKIEIPSVLEYARVNYELNYTPRQLTERDLFDTSFY
ncbi:NMT1-like family protein [uncultured archaeon]|nr:NMT1-like family protein [uncultured archaeon]